MKREHAGTKTLLALSHFDFEVRKRKPRGLVFELKECLNIFRPESDSFMFDQSPDNAPQRG